MPLFSLLILYIVLFSSTVNLYVALAKRKVNISSDLLARKELRSDIACNLIGAILQTVVLGMSAVQMQKECGLFLRKYKKKGNSGPFIVCFPCLEIWHQLR